MGFTVAWGKGGERGFGEVAYRQGRHESQGPGREFCTLPHMD